MKKLLVALFISTVLLTGCSSSVSQEDYDAKVKELESVQKELTDLKKEKAQEGIDQAGAKAWFPNLSEIMPIALLWIMTYMFR